MTTSLFKITPTPPTSIKLDPGQEGKLSFTVESLAAPDKVHAIMLQAQLVGESGKGKEADWLVVGPLQTLSMSGGKTETVTITARPTPTSPRGEHRIKLVIADRDRPNDVYADSPPVTCEVITPLERPGPTRKVPWWLIAAIVGGLVVVVGGILVVRSLAGEAPEAPEEPAGLGEPGRPCSANDQCATGLCAEGLCARPELLRDCTEDKICGPDQKCIEFQPGLDRCVWQPGHTCTSSAECSSRWCNGGICTRDDGKCQSQSDCPSPYLCITGKQRCLIPNGQLCGGDAQCDSGFCRNNRCAPSPCVPACTGRTRCNNDVANPRCLPFFPVTVIDGIRVLEVPQVPWKAPLGGR